VLIAASRPRARYPPFGGFAILLAPGDTSPFTGGFLSRLKIDDAPRSVVSLTQRVAVAAPLKIISAPPAHPAILSKTADMLGVYRTQHDNDSQSVHCRFSRCASKNFCMRSTLNRSQAAWSDPPAT
jgi:hypothetical protein